MRVYKKLRLEPKHRGIEGDWRERAHAKERARKIQHARETGKRGKEARKRDRQRRRTMENSRQLIIE